MGYVIIPFTSDPDQFFSSTLPIDGKNKTLTFRARYNTVAGCWMLTVGDSNGNVIIDSMPLVSNRSNILKQYSYLKIGSAYLVRKGYVEDDAPSESNLGNDFILIWGDTSG